MGYRSNNFIAAAWRIAVAVLAIATTNAAHALDPAIPLAGYHHTTWTSKEGAPAPITTIAQTRDGWLWLGTPAGLYRFDGIKFSKFIASDGAPLQGSNVSNLFAASDGRLIVGYLGGGVNAIDHGKVTTLATRIDVSSTMQTEQDRDGSFWVASMNGLFHIQQGKLTRFGAEQGFASISANSVVLDPYGRLWASGPERQYLLDRQTGKFVPAGLPGPADDIIRSPDGRIWREQDRRWQVLPPPPNTPVKPFSGWRAPSGSAGIFDHDGNHWALHCPQGLCRTPPDQIAQRDSFRATEVATERLDQPWQMSSLTSSIVFEDRENNIWVGTHGGLERFRDNKLVSVPLAPDGLLHEVISDESGRAQLTSYPKGHLFLAGSTTFGPERKFLVSAPADDGGTLVADESGVQVTKNGVTRLLAFPAGAAPKGHPAVLAGGTDNFWLSLVGVGLFNFADGKWVSAATYGLPARGACCLSVDRHGTTWFGYRDGNLARLDQDKATRIVVGAEGDVGSLRFIDAKHELIIAGDEALAVFVRGQFRRLHATDPELLAGVSGIVVTASGDRWLNGRKGAVHITAKAWAAALAAPDQPLEAAVFDVLDGYPGAAQNINSFFTAMQSADGKLWFVGTSGVAWLDPARLKRNLVPPALDISPVNAPGAQLQADGSYALPSGLHTLRLDYTALSLAKPELVRFRYQLAGVDEHWQNAGARRSVVYTNLGPGQYRFRVMATNEDGIDSTSEASVRFTIAPTVIQTGWFKALCVALAAGLIFLVHRWRMRRLAARYWERFQERVAERERIARTLHDNLMQNFQGLILYFEILSDKLTPGDATRTSIDGILDQAATVMTEARQEIAELRSDGENGMADIGAALGKFGTQLQGQFGPRFNLAATGGTEHLTPFAWNEIHAIGREAIFNAYQHADPAHVDVEIKRTNGMFILVVRDDGLGLTSTVEPAGHWGLKGMRERALGLGGKLTIEARRSGGTEVTLRAPAHRVYAARQRPSLLSRWRRRAEA